VLSEKRATGIEIRFRRLREGKPVTLDHCIQRFGGSTVAALGVKVVDDLLKHIAKDVAGRKRPRVDSLQNGRPTVVVLISLKSGSDDDVCIDGDLWHQESPAMRS
jgi:hypothetical protein